MVSNQTINGASGPYTTQPGGYGRNTAFNVKQYASQPADRGPAGPMGSPMDPDMMKDLMDVFSGKGNPEDIMQKMEKKMKDMAPSSKPLPNVQYTEQVDFGIADALPQFPMDINYQDALGYSAESLKNEKEAPGGFNLGANREAMKEQLDKMKSYIAPLLPIVSSFFGDKAKAITDQLEKMFNNPDQVIDEMMNNPMFGNMKNMLPIGGGTPGLSKEILDRDKDGTVSLAEKTAETFYFDNSVNLLNEELNFKLNGGLDLTKDFDKAMVFSTLQSDMASATSRFDGVITTEERKWGMKAGENKVTAELVGDVLDKLLIQHDLTTKAQAFPNN